MSEADLFTLHDLNSISPDDLPLIVLSDNLRSLFSWGIKLHSQGCYNHFMWLVRPGVFASQGMTFTRETIDVYASKCRLKFWKGKLWTELDRLNIITAIERDLDKPWYKRLYDYPAILGQLIGIHELQTPGLRICSDGGDYLKIADPGYDLRYPDPEQVNRWLEANPSRYEVYGRYLPD